jgi:hypothetical protein
MPRSGTLTVKDTARLSATHAALDVGELQEALGRVEGDARAELLELVGAVAAAVIDHVWDKAHLEGHTCKSHLCRPHG